MRTTERVRRVALPRVVSDVMLRIGIVLVAIVAVQVLASVLDSLYLPTPLEVADRARVRWFSGPPAHLFLADAFLPEIGVSVARAIGGWIIGGAIGIVVGAAIGSSRVLSDFVEPIVHFARAVPPPVLVPMLIVLVGLGEGMKLTVIVVGVIWPVLLNTIDGVQSIDKVKLDTARIFGIPAWLRALRVRLPGASPSIFAGLRVSLAIALILMVIAEMLGGGPGLGFEILRAQRRFMLLDMWAGLLVLGVFGYVVNMLLVLAESRLIRWHKLSQKEPS